MTRARSLGSIRTSGRVGVGGRRPGRAALGRLYLILGSAVILLLLAALVGPYLIDWNGFRATFERRASAILGQPVRIVGDADLTLLPVPSLTFDRVEIGESEGRPMMTVDRVAMKLEFGAFLSGRIAITEMTIERPVAEITVDDAGAVDWTIRPGAGVTLDPGRVSLAGVTITDGAISYFDARTNAAVRLTDINTSLVEAPSLGGPWRVAGNLVCRDAPLCADGLPIDFSITTSRANDTGAIGVSTVLVPADPAIAGTLRTDGTIGGGDALRYAGTFRFDRLAVPTAETPASGPATALQPVWRIGGSFDLAADGLALSDFLYDPGQGTVTLSGNASLVFGRNARFGADVATRQIDLDTLIGEGPANPIGIEAAGANLLGRLTALALPDIPGHIRVAIPAVIVSGAALQNLSVDLTAVPADPAAGTPGRWDIAELSVVLPGASRLAVTGMVTTGETLAFDGAIRLTSEQPAALSAWWRGGETATGRLAPFALAFDGRLGADAIEADAMTVEIGPSSANGTFAWVRDPASGLRQLEASFAAGTFDLDQLAALGELLVGPGFTTTDLVADNATIAFTADELRLGEVRMNNVAIDASLQSDVVVVNRFVIEDLAGARFEMASGRLDLSGDTPRGALEARLDAATLDGVVALARQVAPESELTGWLVRSAPHLTPAHLDFRLEAQAAGGPSYQATIAGTVADATLRASVTLTGTVEDWDQAAVTVAIELDSPDTVALARQLGIAVEAIEGTGPTSVRVDAAGVPGAGLTARIDFPTLAGLNVTSSGVFRFDRSGAIAFDGPVAAQGDLGPVMRMAGLVVPGMEAGAATVIDAAVHVGDDGLRVAFDPSRNSIGSRSVGGELALVAAEEGLALTGALALQEIDLGWLLALPTGVDPAPTGDVDSPWPRTPFTGPVLDGVTIDVAIDAERLTLGEALTLDSAVLQLTARRDGGSLKLERASLGGGTVEGLLATTITDGQAAVDGQLILTDVPLAAVVWRRDGQPVAEGTFDLSVEFDGLGRSPAGVIATLSGNGALTIDDGVFHFMSPTAFGLILELADEGEPLGPERLREAFTAYLDAGDLPFPTATATLAIAGGVVTPGRVIVTSSGATSVARTEIDLNRLTLDSRWDLALVADGAATAGPQPSAAIVFTGPIADPTRVVNVTSLVSYLQLRNLRRAEQSTANALEIARFIRMIERINADRNAAAVVPVAPAETPQVAPAEAPLAPLELPPAAPAIVGPVPPVPVP